MLFCRDGLSVLEVFTYILNTVFQSLVINKLLYYEVLK